MKNYKFKRKSLFFILILILSFSLISCTKNEEDKEEVEEYTPVEIEEIGEENVSNSRTFNGDVVANKEVLVLPKMIGTVESVNVKLGDKVNKGDVLFTIEQKDINRSIDQSRVSVDMARKGISQSENAISTAQISKSTAQENYNKAKIDLERAEILFEEGAIPESQLEQAKLGYVSAKSQLETVDAQIRQAQIGLDQAKDQLNQAEIAYNQVKDNLDNTVVRAPITGVVSSLEVKEGQIVNNSQPAAVIVDLSQVFVEISLIEDLVTELAQGDVVRVKVPAVSNQEIASKIDYISPTADVANKLYTVKARLENNENKIKPGMTGEVKIDLDKLSNSIALKRDSIIKQDEKNYVFILQGDKAKKVEVELGDDFGDYVEIISGVSLGDSLITKGQHYLEDGGLVKVVGGDKNESI